MAYVSLVRLARNPLENVSIVLDATQRRLVQMAPARHARMVRTRTMAAQNVQSVLLGPLVRVERVSSVVEAHSRMQTVQSAMIVQWAMQARMAYASPALQASSRLPTAHRASRVMLCQLDRMAHALYVRMASSRTRRGHPVLRVASD